MTEQLQQVRRVGSDGVVTKTTQIKDEEPVAMNFTDGEVERNTTGTRIVWFIAGVLLVLLGFRFVLMLMSANNANGFAHIVYTVSYPFAAPFFSLFSYNLHYGESRVEISTLFAMVVYAVIAFGLSRLMTIRRSSATSH